MQELSAQNFEGREAELAALAAFSTAPDVACSSYWRWLAPAWAGKTALMAHFVLHPPPNTDVLSFFVTARMAGRADRIAFLTALEGQLGEYLNDGDVRCPNQGAFLEALQRAADKARSTGRHLLLVVDGLDEDAGLVTASTGYSIAALLPRNPPQGLRLIVAGRTHPPLPGDVPHSHPLRDPAVNHEMLPSPAAWAVKEDAERNLDALIAAGGLGAEIVGLTAAAGGLSAADLASLTGQAQRRIELILGGSIGRSFQSRPSRWDTSGDGALIVVYSFAHQELLNSARLLLEPAALEGYRNRLHVWVEGIREAGWPPETCEWALTGYPRVLVELQDVERLTALAIDSVRHERMWQTTGADLDALAEIADAFAFHGADASPDLSACVRLAQQRVSLMEKSANAPDGLVFVWARMGHLRRAAEIAKHSKNLMKRLDFASQIVAAAGPTADALAAAVEVVQCLHSPEKPFALAYLGETLAGAGQPDKAAKMATQAQQLVLDIPNTIRRDEARLACAKSLAISGRQEEAAILARSLDNEGMQAEALGVVAEALARTGAHREAIALAHEAVEQTETLTEVDEIGIALCAAGRALALAGLKDQAAELAREAADLIPYLSEESDWLLRSASIVLALAGRSREAIDLIRRIDSTLDQVEVVTAAVEALAEAERYSECVELAKHADSLASTVTSATNHEAAATHAAIALAIAGNARRALELGHSFANPKEIVTVAEALIRSGQTEEGVELAQHAAEVARAIRSAYLRAEVLGDVSAALARCGYTSKSSDLARYAANVARTRYNQSRWAESLVAVSTVLAAHGQDAEAADLAQHVADLAYGTENSAINLETMASVALLLNRSGKVDQARCIAKDVARIAASGHVLHSAPFVDALEVLAHAEEFEESMEFLRYPLTSAQKVTVAIELAGRMKQNGAVGKAVLFARQASRCFPQESSTFTERSHRRKIARALAEAGQTHEALLFVEAGSEGMERAHELVSLANILKEGGSLEDATCCARRAVSLVPKNGTTYSQAQVLIEASRVLSAVGQEVEAVDCICAISELHEQVDGFLAVAEVQSLAGKEDKSISLVERSASLALDIKDEYTKFRTLRSIVTALARHGLTQEAVILSQKITDPGQRSRGISTVALVLADAEVKEQAARLAGQAADLAMEVHDQEQRDEALRDACRALTLAVRPSEGVKAALAITDYYERSEALGDVAKLLARVGEIERAVDTLLLMPDEDEQVIVFREVVGTLTRGGKESQLLWKLRKHADPFWLEEALPIVIRSFQGAPEGAVLLAEALTMKSPVSLAPLIAEFDIQAVKMLAHSLRS
ncbi:hypothetical protein RM863_38715 [Streptomyces sp. DSM 41014]|uniref:Uncharacterized protein n=1 Tax=Streptomyces hintoniae TaxID=3075521 RepID=A0ABU2UY28_9ACTN|nr:hypothetical protein [Streptomyces sp. DSM 41014]MDT0478064.1 hypothetical protein [Streptomyces sp. DSM 41014]